MQDLVVRKGVRLSISLNQQIKEVLNNNPNLKRESDAIRYLLELGLQSVNL